MKITFLGTAGSFLTAKRSYPSILINQDLLLDCGEGTTQKLLKIDAIQNIATICLTHLHNDHFVGIFSLLWYYWLSGRKANLEIIGPPHTKDTINKILELINSPKGMQTHFELEFFELEDTDEIQTINRDYNIKAVRVNHSILGFAYRIEDEIKSVCYSGDTAPSENLVRLALNCDFLIFESTFPSEVKRVAHKYGHSTPYDLAQLAIESNCGQIAMVHIASTYIHQIDKFRSQAEKKLNKNIIIPEDLTEINI